MLRSLRARFAKPTLTTRRPIRRATLGVESLEHRETPAVLTVNSLADNNVRDNFLTLEEAIRLNVGTLTKPTLTAAEQAQVSGTPGGATADIINFGVAGTINMVGVYPSLSKKVSIIGPDEAGTAVGQGGITISGQDARRHFTVTAAGEVTLKGVHLTHGKAPVGTSGGSILNDGKLNLYRVEIDNSTTDTHGGAIENNGTLTVDSSWLHDNTSTKVGGAIDNNTTATITATSITNNKATGNGGGIWSNGTLSLQRSTIVSNTSAGTGGGIRTAGGTTTIVSCTINGNGADSDLSGGETGGGISNGGGTVSLTNSLVAGNIKGFLGRSDIDGAATGSFNFISVDTGLTGITNGVNGNQVGTGATPKQALTLQLGQNGGFGPTVRPDDNSPLLDAGASAAIAGTTDQRGAARVGTACDIGAYEVQNPLSPVGVADSLYSPGSSTANEAFVKGLYQATLLRAADGPGLAFWTGVLAGHPERRSIVANEFVNSDENRKNEVTFFYRYFLDRAPDQGGLNFWVGLLRNGTDEGVVMRDFLLSPEYTGKNDNTKFVNTLYYSLLGRAADTGGFNYWKGLLDTNQATRSQEVESFLRADETIKNIVTSYYKAYLKAAPSAAQLTAGVNQIKAGTTFGTVAGGILGSDAFYNNGLGSVG